MSSAVYDYSQRGPYTMYRPPMPPTSAPQGPLLSPTPLPRPAVRPAGAPGNLAPLPMNEKPQTTVYVGKIPTTVDDVFLKKVLGVSLISSPGLRK